MKILVPKSIGASITSAVVREPSITGFSRLETSPVSPKLDQGLQAMIADPLWMLARQWQFDEFQGNDAGTPLTTSFTVQGLPVTGLKPGRDKTLGGFQTLKDDSPPVEALVEFEPALSRHPRLNAEAGQHALRMASAATLPGLGAALLKSFALTVTAPEDPDSDVRGLLWSVVLSGRAVDAAKLAAALRPNLAADGTLTALPAALTVPAGEKAAAPKLLAAWLAWLDQFVLEGKTPNAGVAVEPARVCVLDVRLRTRQSRRIARGGVHRRTPRLAHLHRRSDADIAGRAASRAIAAIRRCNPDPRAGALSRYAGGSLLGVRGCARQLRRDRGSAEGPRACRAHGVRACVRQRLVHPTGGASGRRALQGGEIHRSWTASGFSRPSSRRRTPMARRGACTSSP